MQNNKVFINRTLNVKKLKYLGFDMDHTLVRYNSAAFEELAHSAMIDKLIKLRNYPAEIRNLKFDYSRSIRGLVIDKKNGNILKLNRFGAIRASYHGTAKIGFEEQKQIYKSIYIDLGDSHNYSAIDTAFSTSFAVLYAQLVDFKDKAAPDRLPTYEAISNDLDYCLDGAHSDGSLKDTVRNNLDKFIIKDPEAVVNLERYKKHDKKLFVLTNSDYHYTKLLLDYAINPFLKDHKSWIDLFEIVITRAKKPRFFYDNLDFFKVDPVTGRMENHYGPLTKGVYQGGCATAMTNSLGVGGDDILYIGDHIYHDVLRIKKDCNWRTALVVEELDDEIAKIRAAAPYDKQIAELMNEKQPFEDEYLELSTRQKEGATINDKRLHELQETVNKIDAKISGLILKREALFNAYWGEIMRVGNEESYFARQIENFACIYMAKLGDFLACSPRSYFRAHRVTLPHEE
ncbi:MAG TPA: HAD-IG family 5'-nucleotidase [Bdellovibrionales bacterium]|nr:HAD-IG family 5'-nucleotidase [Bdellovibrionales bacterium]